MFPCHKYIDDRHLGQLKPPKCHPFTWSNLDLARAASFIATLILVLYGYFIGLKKSVFDPVQSILFLGFISDSVKQAFILPDEKKKKFATLRDSLISMKLVPIKRLQKFTGKVRQRRYFAEKLTSTLERASQAQGQFECLKA